MQEQADALDDLLKYVEEMIKQEIKNQVDAIEKQVDAMKDLVDLQKKSLDLEREKDKYSKTVAEKTKELAKLQQQLALLDLDDSREAQAEKAKLLEKIAKLQEDLADEQADHAYDATTDMLDDMYDAYKKEKQKEIDALEDSISSEEKLYRLAIERIQTQWDTLYQQLLDWNYQYGTVTNDEITAAWNAASAAVQQYGSYLNAVLQTQQQIAALEASSRSSSSSIGSSGTSSTPNVVGNSGNYDTSGGQEMENVHNIIKQMYANSQAWFGSNEQQRAQLEKNQFALAAQLQRYGINAVRDDQAGVWYVNKIGGEKLYEKYKQYTYHEGGIVGDDPTLKQDELFAKLKKGEAVLTETQQEVVDKALNLSGFVPVPPEETMLGKYGKVLSSISGTDLMSVKMQEQIKQDAQQAQNIVTHGGDTYDIDVPVQIYPLQKLTEQEVKKLAKIIGKNTIDNLNSTTVVLGEPVKHFGHWSTFGLKKFNSDF